MSDVTDSSLVRGSSTQGAKTSFDLHDEKSAIVLLRRIHQSTISPDDKNELRDAVFVFRNNSSSVITPEFTDKFTQHGFALEAEDSIKEVSVATPDTPPNTPPNASSQEATPASRQKPNGFGLSRPSPQFSSVAQNTSTAEVHVTEVVSDPAQSPESNPVAEVPKVPDLPTVPRESEVASDTNSTPLPAPTTPTIPTSSPSVSQEAPERIKEIKKMVNQLVGNPVNLIDVNNNVGREYMNSLLDAMKKNNGGTAQQVEQAMARLEEAFSAVKGTVGATGKVEAVVEKEEVEVSGNVNDATAVTPLVEDIKKQEPESIPALETEDITPRPPAFSPTIQGQASTPTADGYVASQNAKAVQGNIESVLKSPLVEPKQEQESVSVQTEPTPSTPVVPQVASAVPTPHIPPTESVAPTNNPTQGTPSVFSSVHQTHVQTAVTPALASTPEAPSVPVPNAMPLPATERPVDAQASQLSVDGMLSVAKQKQIENLMTAKKQKTAINDKQKQDIEIAEMNPLMTPEVTNGLQQLLSEWELFKSSGIFGTGASGIEHSLYKKLAKLNMTAVVAGRYEGATPQIKRSITDYMNGWRYEEGIVQEQGELFEHYLRRVIKHIINKRTK